MIKQTRAAQVAAYAEKMGWQIAKKKVGELRKLKCSRGKLDLIIAWDGTTLVTPIRLLEWNDPRPNSPEVEIVARRKIWTMKEVKEILTDHGSAGDQDDVDTLERLRGRRIYWRNSISGSVSDAQIPRYCNYYHIHANHEGRKYLTFTDSVGFHSVFLDAITRIGRASA